MSAVRDIQLFCRGDRDYFESPGRLPDAATRFELDGAAVPSGWRRVHSGLWVGLRPDATPLPEQGWKIHISAVPESAARTLDIAADICLRHDVAFKFLRSVDALRFGVGKYMPRPNSGKFITVYPPAEKFEALTNELATALDGSPGPYVLSDLRIGRGPVFVRYGAFVEQWSRTPDGTPVRALRNAAGELVPDEREPVFRVPDWVRPPDFLRPHLAARAAATGGAFPYRLLRALHFTNAGGVYLAEHRDTGQRVVLREARPHSGLDETGADAVTRLRREYDTLTRLAGLDFVPRVHGIRTVWEHEFLIEDHIEGMDLVHAVIYRYPLRLREPSEESVAGYLHWVEKITGGVSRALDALHARGVSFGDLHPANIIVRPDDSVALVDFEYAGAAGSSDRLRFGALGFQAPPAATGAEADRYALRRVWLMMLMPVIELTHHDPGKAATLETLARQRFGLGPDAGPPLPAIRGDARASGESAVRELFEAAEPRWPDIRDRLVAGILGAATPDRTDRLFPADPMVFDEQGAAIAHGAAGVLLALHRSGAGVPAEHVDWLAAAARRVRTGRGQGLLDGLPGIAAALHELGRPDDALEALARCRAEAPGPVPGLFRGRAGVALAQCHFAALTGDATLLDEAAGAARELDALVRDGRAEGLLLPPTAGLLHGLSGAALLQLRLYRTTGEEGHLRACRRALGFELGHCVAMPDGTMQVRSGHRHKLYLDEGSGGIALAAREYLTHREDRELAAFVAAVRRGCGQEYLREPGLFQGRAGLLAMLNRLAGPDGAGEVLPQIRRLAWHAVYRDGSLFIPGRFLLRFSADVATGSAGVLLALRSVFEGGNLLGALVPGF